MARRYGVDEYDVQLDGGIEYGRFGELRLGVYRSLVHASVHRGAANLPRFDADGVASPLPCISTPGTGRRIRGTDRPWIFYALFSRTALGAADSYDQVDCGYAQFFGRGRRLFAVSGGTNLGSQLPVYDEFLVGGLFSLGGYSEGEIRGQVMAGATVGYRYRLVSLRSGYGEGVYVGVLVDAANAWPSTHEV
jgi:hypothetical protein